ncbi:dynein axonemal heavy chain 12-like [Ischnura elegans]|uniref:dynein axonemal heavy chain 12-like n=1 Tax=Ischnura elegans TaxID=197161 RepID=UPI001ED87398|nr:dynein axonemal heavy chain 12-like [Ischnura elegans]
MDVSMGKNMLAKEAREKENVDECLSLTRPAAKLVAVERLLLNRCDEAQILALWKMSDDKLAGLRDMRSCCLKILRMHASSIILPRLLDSWIKGFLRLIKPKLLYQFPEVTYNTLLGVLKDYDCIQHKLHVHCTVKLKPSETNILVPTWPGWKRRGKTENHANYLETRQKLKQRLFMYHPVVRKVIDSAYCKVPMFMADLEKYRESKSLPLDQFIISLIEDISIAKSMFFVGFYNDVTEILRTPHALRGLRGASWRKFLRLITMIVEVQATELMRRTIENFLEVMGDDRCNPKIDIHLIVEENKFTLYPGEEEVEEYYIFFLSSVKGRFKEELPSLEQYVLGHSVIPPYIDVQLDDSIWEKAKTELKKLLKRHFAELQKYICDMEDTYGFIISPEWIHEEVASSSEKMECDYLLERRTIYQTFDDIFYALGISSFQFSMCHLLQGNAVTYLRKITTAYRDFYSGLIMCLYEQETLRIIKTYDDIKVLSEAIPTNPKFLVVTGKYMLSLQPGELMLSFKEKVIRNNEMLEMLMGWATFTEEDMSFFTEAILSYKGTIDIRKQYNKDFDLNKSRFEDQLYHQSHDLSDRLEKMLPKIEMFSYMNDLDKLDVYKEDIHKMAAVFKMYEDEIAEVNEEEALLDIPISGFPEYDELRSSIYPMTKLITYLDLWKTMEKKWVDGTFEDLDAASVEMTSTNIEKMIKHYQKMIKDLILQQIDAGAQRRIAGSVDDPATLAGPLKMCEKVLKRIKRFNEKIIYISTLCNKSLRHSHWLEMKGITGLDLRPNSGTTLRKILKLNIGPYIEKMQLISLGASEEAKLLEEYHQTQEEVEAATYQVAEDEELGVAVLEGLDDLQVDLDNHIQKMQIISGSAFAKPYAYLYKEWTEKLFLMNENIDLWKKVQSLWLYLLPVFSLAETPESLKKEKPLFKAADSFVKNVIREVSNTPNVIKYAGQLQLLKDSQVVYETLCNILAGMNKYIEEACLSFPRFFFISNEEVMIVLTHANDLTGIKKYLGKCFAGIYDLNVDDSLNIVSMISAEGEEVPLKTIIKVKDFGNRTDKWMLQLESEMRSTLKEVIKESVNDYPMKERTDWLKCWPAQVIECVSIVYWTAYVSEQFEMNASWETVESQLVLQLTELIALVRESIPALLRKTVCVMITKDVHLLNIAEETFISGMQSLTDYQWLSRLRYYWEDDELIVKVAFSSLSYGYEYLGIPPGFVCTPLTDRCVHTIMGAYNFQLFASLYGPSATGKTGIAIELGRALGVLCMLFNCSKAMDCSGMCKLLKGLATTGSWLCFDDFERIEQNVLSVMTQHISNILNAIKQNSSEILLNGCELAFKPYCYVCITMSPRREVGDAQLPENLKAFFRSVAVVMPDIALVAEVILVSHGFSAARELAWKVISFHNFCATQLSLQDHYDFGFRSIAETAIGAGNLKFQLPSEDERVLVVRTIKNVNFSKLTQKDLCLCEGAISKLFPGTEIPPSDELFLTTVKEVCKEMKLLPVELFIESVSQINEVINRRHALIIVGDTMSGKTTALRILMESLKRMHDMDESEPAVTCEVVNPKSITLEQLYGKNDEQTQKWKDGIVPKILRNFASLDSMGRKWLVFDGSVDPTWMEILNSTLDNNGKLCLSSGEVIVLSPRTSIIFEVINVRQISPAIISKCGIVYMSPDSLDWATLVEAWICSNEDEWWHEFGSIILALFEWTLKPCIEFIESYAKKIVNIGTPSIVRSMVNIMDMFLKESEKVSDKKVVQAWFQGLYYFACIYGLGGILDADSMQTFDEFVKSLVRGHNSDHHPPADVLPLTSNLPDGLISDYLFSLRGNVGTWKSWSDIMRNVKYNMVIKIGSLLIPTPETVRCLHLVNMHITHKKPLLLVGPSGTGKSAYIKYHFIHELPTEEYWTQNVTMTMNITAKETQEFVLSQLFRSGKSLYKPPEGRQCVMFIDDINVPKKDSSGSQPPIELFRQYLDHKYWYDLEESHPIHLADILLLAAMQPMRGTQDELYIRFLSHFNIHSMSPLSDASLNKIYRSILHMDLMNHNFGADIVGSVVAIVNATLKIYMDVREYLLPNPLKCHYLFNLHDVSRVIQGCSLIYKESVDSRKVLIRLWTHEILREFYDRLLNLHEKDWLIQKISWCIKTHFKENFETVFENLGVVKGKRVHDALKTLLFGSVLYPDVPFKLKKYEEMNFSRFQEVVENYLLEYNEVEKVKLDLISFKYALEHLSRLCRVMAMPRGSALLIGFANVGKMMLSRLAAALIGHKYVELNASNSGGWEEWRNSLKKILKSAGGKSKPTVLALGEMHMTDMYLADVEALLQCGKVPNMFSIEEKMELLEMVGRRAQGSRRTVNIDPLTLYAFFVNCCKDNLHLILCMRPTGPGFRERLFCYPSFTECCTVDVFEKWPEEAIEKAAVLRLGRLNLDENVKRSLIDAAVTIHVSSGFLGRLYSEKIHEALHFPLGSYFELLELCETLIPQRKEKLFGKKQRYMAGLEKLSTSAEMSESMQKAVDEMQPELLRANEESKMMLEAIEKETAALEKASVVIKEDEIEANEKAKEAQELKDDCEKDLAQVIPILEGAVKSLNTLKPADITLVKSMKNPPEAVKLVMAAVCVMLDIKPDRLNEDSSGKKVTDYWGPSKKILSDMSFLQKLKDYDKHNIPPEIMVKIRKDYIKHPIFKPKKVKKASRAAEGLCKWVLAMSNFDEVEKIAAPKREKFETADREYQETKRALEEKRAKIHALESKISELKSSLEATDEHKKNLEAACRLSMERLKRAERLLGGLSGEEGYWLEVLQTLDSQLESILGDVLMSSAFIAYLSPCDQSIRTGCIAYWKRLFKEKNIPLSKDYLFHNIMEDEVNIQEWLNMGLPKDLHSVENAVITRNSRRFCLIIDPQFLATFWIKNWEGKNSLNVLKVQDPNALSTIATSITQGAPVLLENFCGTVDPAFLPLIKREYVENGGRLFIVLESKTLCIHKNFRLYVTSSISEPEFVPDVYAMFTIVNFSVSKEGLEDQLLSVAVDIIKPQVQQDWMLVNSMMDKNRKQVLKVRNDILNILSSVSGNILDSEPAVAALDSSKLLSVEIMEEKEKLKKMEADVVSERSQYKGLADHASKIYFSLNDLPTVNPVYHFSLEWFIDVFKSSILSSIQESVKVVTLEKLSENFTFTFYSSVCQSILSEDKLLFSFLLTLSLAREELGITTEELEFLATGGIYTGFLPSNPADDWLPEEIWKNIIRLCNLTCFKGFLSKFKENKALWKSIYQSNEPQLKELPAPWNKKLNNFQKLLFFRAFHPDKVRSSLEEFVKNQIGPQYLSTPGFNIHKSYSLSKETTPLLMIPSQGVNPLLDIIDFASSQDIHAELETIPMGPGQDILAENAIQDAQLKGQWVCLENIHLAGPWMSNLENIVNSLSGATVLEAGFRLWMTSYPMKNFPQSIARKSIKVVKEAPSGLKWSLLRSFTSGPIAESSFYANYRDKDSILRRYMFSLCFFHGIIIERGKYGPLGWNESYNFSESDLHISLKHMEMFLTGCQETPHDSIRYLVGECIYGGQIIDNEDRLTLGTILFDLMHPNIELEYYPSLTKTGQPFYLPVGGSYGDYLAYIKNLPDTFGPETFGLHENADVLRVKRESKVVCSKLALALLKPDPHEHERFSGSLLDLVESITLEVPENLEINQEVDENQPADATWIDSVLEHELTLFNKLITTIRVTLEMLRDRIHGFDLLTPDLEKIGSALLQGKVPDEWMTVSFPSSRHLGSYVKNLKERVKFFQEWIDNGQPSHFWLSGFFNPKALLTGFSHSYSFDANVPVSDVQLVVTPNADEESPLLRIYGLFMGGASWDESLNCIAEAKPGFPHYEMPELTIVPVLLGEDATLSEYYSCPLYISSDRGKLTGFSINWSNYIVSLNMRCKESPEYWIKRRAALICEIDN